MVCRKHCEENDQIRPTALGGTTAFAFVLAIVFVVAFFFGVGSESVLSDSDDEETVIRIVSTERCLRITHWYTFSRS